MSVNQRLTYEELRERFVVCLEAAVRAHEAGDLRAIETGFDELVTELPRDAGPEFDKLLVAIEFWDCWIDAGNHDWLYYPGMAADDWPQFARAIVQDLQQNHDITDERVLERFDFRRRPARTSIWSRLKGFFSR